MRPFPAGTCSSGEYWSTKTIECEECAAGHFSEGGQVTQCTKCPGGKTVSAGQGLSAQDCRWGE